MSTLMVFIICVTILGSLAIVIVPLYYLLKDPTSVISRMLMRSVDSTGRRQ